MTEIKQTLKTPNGEKILDNSTDKDKIIKDLEQKISDLENQNNDLDYLLNSGRNKFENERNKKLKELETKLKQPSLTNQELLFNLLKKLESEKLMFCFEDEDNKLFLEDQTSEGGESRIYLFNLDIKDDKISVFYEKGEYWKEVNDKFREKFLKEQKKPIILLDEFEKNNSKLTKIQGILTSNLRTRKSSDTPYMAFFRNDSVNKHSLEKCERTKCQDCEVPVVFRIANTDHDNHLPDNFTCVIKHREFGDSHWIKPNLSKGDKVLLTGHWAKSDQSKRPSFTCYSYQILKDYE